MAALVQLPSRPNFGLNGRHIYLKANFFAVTSLPGQTLHHYDCLILPEVPPAKNRAIYQLWEEEFLLAAAFASVSLSADGTPSYDAIPNLGPFPRTVYDGRRNVYSVRALPLGGDTAVFYVDYAETDDPTGKRRGVKRFKLMFKRVTEINMQRLGLFLDGRITDAPYDAIMALDVIFRHRPSLTFTTIGRCFYTADSAAPISGGAQLWQGFHQSVRPTQGGMLVNLDVSATAFHQPGPVVDLIAQILGRNHVAELRYTLTERDRGKVEKALKGLKIYVTHRGLMKRRFRITRLTTTAANRTMFAFGDKGEEESVSNYFAQKYGHPLQFGNLPCLVVGDPARHVYLPMEVCEIVPGQRHLRKLNERQTAEMIKFTCQPPQTRSTKIGAGIQILQQRDIEYLREFHVDVSQEMVTIPARILSPPSISYHPASREPVITPREGSWNLRDKMVAQGVTLRSWSVVAFGSEADYPVSAVQKFITLLVQTCEECGLYVASQQPPISYTPPYAQVEKALIDAYMVAGNSFLERPQLILCILPNTSVPLYAEIKRVSDTVIGIATQCVLAKHVFAAKRQYCANVCLKINVKLGGMNSYLSNAQLPFVSERPTIIFGADVTHPAPGSTSNQSIAALVGSMDAQCSRYAAAIRVQRGRQEVIQDLSGMVVELLKTFYQTCGSKPDRVIMYRDGVSEGQFSEVLRNEVEAIQRACIILEPSYRPLITFVAVQKRHHARFFPIQREDADRSGNILPGTIIESGVTHPSEFDFYLCSHPGLQGTSKPTHYHVLYDENKFDADGLQELTYRLCYLYCRATRSVSVCPPAYYAHTVAARARFHASQEPPLSDSEAPSPLGLGVSNMSMPSKLSGYITPRPMSSSPVPGGMVGSGYETPRYGGSSAASSVMGTPTIGQMAGMRGGVSSLPSYLRDGGRGDGRHVVYGVVKSELAGTIDSDGPDVPALGRWWNQ
ncbi:hypothetical protein SmJEL517_g05103 [Synchytrium microbalum]|uniref:Piwi domain-containing protein n=1 Tax=Synchytrium microbalum TaxID=1806994 RepID=A0A507C0V6_9FUNG|nr:uncharacterized protein SmJEL517_g05103 [Synchytrium microbalum]TPX31606.1 hypothetical protein SmJEL517_g05103 [Synchytrium microbalum]